MGCPAITDLKQHKRERDKEYYIKKWAAKR